MIPRFQQPASAGFLLPRIRVFVISKIFIELNFKNQRFAIFVKSNINELSMQKVE